MIRQTILCVLMALSSSAIVRGQELPKDTLEGPFTIGVDENSISPDGEGKFWQTAFHHLQEALQYASEPVHNVHAIWIANGTYEPGTTASASFHLVDRVKVYGGFRGADGETLNGETNLTDRDILGQNAEVILSGHIDSQTGPDNSYHVVSVLDDPDDPGHDEVMTLDGVTVTGGAAVQPLGDETGGGIWVENATLVLVNSTITENAAGSSELFSFGATGGGLGYHVGLETEGGATISDAAVYNCKFISNGVHGASCFGGAMYLGKIGIEIVNCLFANNQAGGTFENPQDSKGGAIYTIAQPDGAKIVNCTFAHNVVAAPAESSELQGPAVAVGGQGQTRIINSIAWDNKRIIDGLPQAASFWVATFPPTSLEVTYSDVENGWVGEGNIEAEPMFTNAAAMDYYLRSESPAKEAGDDGFVPQDTYDVDNDTNETEPTPDLGLAKRIQGTVDMGAYEHCDLPHDVIEDGFIGFKDLLEVLSFWGECADPENCPPDVDGDGIVGFTDLLAILSYWGPCDNFGVSAAPSSIVDCFRQYGAYPEKLAKCIEAMMLAGTP